MGLRRSRYLGSSWHWLLPAPPLVGWRRYGDREWLASRLLRWLAQRLRHAHASPENGVQSRAPPPAASATEPRSANDSPAPATRSRTVEDTRTSPACAWAATERASSTGAPRSPVAVTSHSP